MQVSQVDEFIQFVLGGEATLLAEYAVGSGSRIDDPTRGLGGRLRVDQFGRTGSLTSDLGDLLLCLRLRDLDR